MMKDIRLDIVALIEFVAYYCRLRFDQNHDYVLRSGKVMYELPRIRYWKTCNVRQHWIDKYIVGRSWRNESAKSATVAP